MTTREFQQKKPLSILFTYFKPHRGLFILDLVCATVVALIDLAFPLVTRKSMYDLLPNQQYRTFFIVMGVMMAAFIVRALLYYVISYWGHTFGILVEADIRRDLFTHVQELDVSFFDHNRTGQLMSRLTSDLFEITELAHHGPEDLLISTLTIVGLQAQIPPRDGCVQRDDGVFYDAALCRRHHGGRLSHHARRNELH